MNQNELSLFYSYIFSNRIALENEINELQSRIRFRKISITDCVELICATQRLETFIEVTEHLRKLLEIGGSK